MTRRAAVEAGTPDAVTPVADAVLPVGDPAACGGWTTLPWR
ncbi:hypothetical protein [Kutzneria sp. NPDC052558]